MVDAFVRIIVMFALAFVAQASAADATGMIGPAAATPLAGVKGRIDHFAADPGRHRLFIAALGNDTVETIGSDGTRHVTTRGFREPQGIAYVPDSNRLFVANGEGDRVDVLDASSLAVVRRIEALSDADNVRYDAGSHTVWVGYGKGALAILDAATGDLVGRVPLPGHPESFELEREGPRAFVNIPSARKVVVVDRIKRQAIASWDVPGAAGNYPMALDEKGHRLFTGTRSPAVMLVYDTESGKVVARVPIGADTDDIFFDAARKRIYVICGEGRIDVIRQETADRYGREASIGTAPGARTGLFVPEENSLYVAAPASGATPARILAFRLR